MTNETTYTNYLKLEKSSLLYAHYLFLDTHDYLADQLFVRHEVHVSFGKEFEKDGTRYRIIMCKVRKKDEQRFLNALSELEKKMLLLGYRDYPDACRELNQMLANVGTQFSE